MSLETLISTIAAFLTITPIDVYILFSFVIFLGLFAILGIARIYSVFFGIVLGIGIFVLLSTLLSPQYQTPETRELIGEWLAKVIVGSSVYLIFILSVLVPMNGNLALTYPKNKLESIIQTLLLSLGLFMFYSATVIGLIERSYIFTNTNSIFFLIKSTLLYSSIQGAKFYVFLFAHFPTIILLWIGFMIYKLLFADILNTVIASIMTSIKNKRSTKGGGHEGGNEDHGEHEEVFEEHDMHEGHGGHHGH